MLSTLKQIALPAVLVAALAPSNRIILDIPCSAAATQSYAHRYIEIGSGYIVCFACSWNCATITTWSPSSALTPAPAHSPSPSTALSPLLRVVRAQLGLSSITLNETFMIYLLISWLRAHRGQCPTYAHYSQRL